MECTQKKQLVAYPRVRIEKTWIRQFYSNKKYRNEGTTHLFSLVFVQGAQSRSFRIRP